MALKSLLRVGNRATVTPGNAVNSAAECEGVPVLIQRQGDSSQITFQSRDCLAKMVKLGLHSRFGDQNLGKNCRTCINFKQEELPIS